MAGFTACEGTGKNAVDLERHASQADANGWNRTAAKTYGRCPDCGRLVAANGLVATIKIVRHKRQDPEGTDQQ
jgi:hypothetical protein